MVHRYFFFLYSFFLILIIGSCTEELEFPDIDLPNKLVMNCIYTQDSVFKVHLTNLRELSSNGDVYFSDARIELYENNIFLELLSFEAEKNIYVSASKAKCGVEYTLIASVDDYPEIKATDKLPFPISIDSTNVYLSAYYDSWEEYYLDVVDVFFRDPCEELNYYELSSYLLSVSENVHGETEYNYSLPWANTSKDPVILSEGILENNKYQQYLVFSDKLLNNDAHITFMPFLQMDAYFTVPEAYTMLRSISENYYLFRKQWYKYMEGNLLGNMNGIEQMSNMSFMVTPTDAYSNVVNGLGIFASYTQTTKLMEVKTK